MTTLLSDSGEFPLDILNAATLLLQNLAQDSSRFYSLFDQAFAGSYDTDRAEAIRSQWAKGDGSQWVQISVLPATEMNGALGAYARSTDTIYISQALVNEGSEATLLSVLLEELGHAVDAQIKSADTPGDEGELFAALVQGQPLNDAQLARLQSEDDRGTVYLKGQALAVEQANTILEGTSKNQKNLG